MGISASTIDGCIDRCRRQADKKAKPAVMDIVKIPYVPTCLLPAVAGAQSVIMALPDETVAFSLKPVM